MSSIAETLLLVNDNPSEPLNRQITNWISNGIRYIATDDVLDIVEFAPIIDFQHEIKGKIKHDGVLRTNVRGTIAKKYSGGTVVVTLILQRENVNIPYSNKFNIAWDENSVSVSHSSDIPVKKGDRFIIVFSVLNARDDEKFFTSSVRVTLCGFPTFADF